MEAGSTVADRGERHGDTVTHGHSGGQLSRPRSRPGSQGSPPFPKPGANRAFESLTWCLAAFLTSQTSPAAPGEGVVTV